MKRKINWLLAGIALTLVTALVMPAAAQEDIDTSRKCDADARVMIENICGEVIVIGWDKKEVQVRGVLGDDVEEFIFEGDADDIDIRVEIEERRNKKGFWGWSSINNSDDTFLEIHLPHGCDVRIGTVSADVEVTDLKNELNIDTVSGDIDVEGKMKEADIESVSGEIKLELEAEELSASTVSGDVVVRDGTGSISLESVSGELEVDGENFDELEMETVSGEIRVEGSFVKNGGIYAETHSGEIFLLVPADLEADFDLSTLSGDIDSDFGPSKRRSKKRSFFGGREMSFTTGDGDIRIQLETFSGDIAIEGR